MKLRKEEMCPRANNLIGAMVVYLRQTCLLPASVTTEQANDVTVAVILAGTPICTCLASFKRPLCAEITRYYNLNNALCLLSYATNQISDERLRTKALNVKIRCLEQERDELQQRLRHYEEHYGASPHQPVPIAEGGTSGSVAPAAPAYLPPGKS